MHLVNMKCFKFLLLTFSFVLIGAAAMAQNSKLYGYSQVVIPGAAAAKRITDDAGNVVERSTEDIKTSYLVYLATTAKTRVYPVEMWIKGEPYSAMPQSVSTTPVSITSGPVIMGRTQKTELVPKTTQKVTQLVPSTYVAAKSNAQAAKLAQQNELVVVYKQGGKTYIKTLKNLTELSPKALQ